ncbi:unnamed protein product, partial [Didymodactylos carnosus]
TSSRTTDTIATDIIQPNSNENHQLKPSLSYDEPLLNLNNDKGYLSPIQPILSG